MWECLISVGQECLGFLRFDNKGYEVVGNE